MIRDGHRVYFLYHFLETENRIARGVFIQNEKPVSPDFRSAPKATGDFYGRPRAARCYYLTLYAFPTVCLVLFVTIWAQLAHAHVYIHDSRCSFHARFSVDSLPDPPPSQRKKKTYL